jgi:hypothetical protein
MRKVILGIVLAIAGSGCTSSADSPDGAAGSEIQIQSTLAPFAWVSAGPVRAMIPTGWRAVPAGEDGDARLGFVASPGPRGWLSMNRASGMAATWVDASRVGVPSDFYYLAARGPALARLVDGERCSLTSHHVFADHIPSFSPGRPSSGDYVVRSEGLCAAADGPATRWASFVAAPGFGPARQIGISSSGLYVVVATAPESPHAPALLDRLLDNTTFAGATIDDFIAAVRRSATTG